ncbi:hypothetical protein M404DRAFT_611756 [Pisolithus tinctorius Marx 270]|uniref:Uncharacterized protein n=1 Tax=Pisolithus tinctorius Marx 270 TaxID=870435 RepID=A0A0C3J3G7_PISTI|nr:hypothetical protein M404DRAFT_611756 [Pisolithus tinctorius Marx 270]
MFGLISVIQSCDDNNLRNASVDTHVGRLISGFFPLLSDSSSLLSVLHYIDWCCSSSSAVPPVPPSGCNTMTSRLYTNSERHWYTLLSDFCTVPLTERVRVPSAPASICATKSHRFRASWSGTNEARGYSIDSTVCMGCGVSLC